MGGMIGQPAQKPTGRDGKPTWLAVLGSQVKGLQPISFSFSPFSELPVEVLFTHLEVYFKKKKGVV